VREAPQLAKISRQKAYRPSGTTSFTDSRRLTLLL
jgi:hypothetical protein